MRTTVFAYKGIVGIKSDVKAEGLLNDPLKPGQLGFVVKADCVDIQSEALELLKQVKKSSDDIGEVDVFRSDNGLCFSWLGGPLKAFKPADITGSNSYDASELKANADVKPPEDFIAFVDGLDGHKNS